MKDKLENFIKETFGSKHSDAINLLLTCHYIYSTYNDVEKALDDYDNNVCFSNNSNCPNLVLYDSKDENPKVQLFYLIENLEEIENAVRLNRMFITKLKNQFSGEILMPRFQTLLNEIYEDEAFDFEAVVVLNKYIQDSALNDADNKIWKLGSNDDCSYKILDKKRIELQLDNPLDEESKEANLKYKFTFKNPNNADKAESNTFCFETKEHRVVVCALEAKNLVKCYQKYSDKVFEQNIRYSITGDTNSKLVNSDIQNTVINEPDKFILFNNGITIVSEEVGDINIEDNSIELSNFSIVNGAQTVSNLVEINKKEPDNIEKVLVIAKIIQPKNGDFDDVVEKITKSSNNQKPVKSRDLKSNAKEMKSLQETFKQNGVILNIKRGDKMIAIKKYIENNFGSSKPKNVNNDYLGQVILSNILASPTEAMQKKNKLFDKPNYNKVFLNPHITNDMIYDCYVFDEKTNKVVNKLIDSLDYGEENAEISLFIPRVIPWLTSFLWIIYNNLDRLFEILFPSDLDVLLDENKICYNKSISGKFSGFNANDFDDFVYDCFKVMYEIYKNSKNNKGKMLSIPAFSYRNDFYASFVKSMLKDKINSDERKEKLANKLKNLFKFN